MSDRMTRGFSYVGRMTAGSMDWTVMVRSSTGEEIPLEQRQDLANHSPSGFAWGYNGSGPSQLALAMLAHYFGASVGRRTADELALRYYQAFKAAVIAELDGRFELAVPDMQDKLRAIMESRAAL